MCVCTLIHICVSTSDIKTKNIIFWPSLGSREVLPSKQFRGQTLCLLPFGVSTNGFTPPWKKSLYLSRGLPYILININEQKCISFYLSDILLWWFSTKDNTYISDRSPSFPVYQDVQFRCEKRYMENT